MRKWIWAALAVVALGFASPAQAQIYSSSGALVANQVVRAAPGKLYSFEVSQDGAFAAAPWWIMIYDATVAPADGAVTPAKCFAQPPGATSASYAFNVPISFGLGIVIGVSSTGCFTKTQSVHAFISGDVQ